MYKIVVLKVSHPSLPEWAGWYTPVLYKDGNIHKHCNNAFSSDGADELAMEWGMESWEDLLD